MTKMTKKTKMAKMTKDDKMKKILNSDLYLRYMDAIGTPAPIPTPVMALAM